jgi:hypothetical protein
MDGSLQNDTNFVLGGQWSICRPGQKVDGCKDDMKAKGVDEGSDILKKWNT